MSSLWRRFRLFIYFTLTTPTDHDRIRAFRFHIPLLMKTEYRVFSTEADALRFLNASGLDLPIPRLLDSIVMDGNTYTIMSRIPGSLLLDEIHRISEPDLRAIVNDVRDVLDRLWTLKQSPADAGKVMLSASGDGLPDPMAFYDTYWGPCPSILDCYFRMSANLSIEVDNPWTEEELVATHPDAMRAVTADRIVWVHRDLRLQNILIRDGRLSGIIDWEHSGWFPCHWQLHTLRIIKRVINPKRICSAWEDVVFPPETEAAFRASMTVLYYHVA
ncbi:kinase-like protein [Pholiota molesta]|jgi:serine/threonine protein kinase|nr:kinase-like protein [Pholiota molesta]